MEQIEKQYTQEDYPAVELAYPIALSSYESIVKRIDALETRSQTIMAFAATLTVAVPGITAGRGLTFRSGWFITAIVLFCIANIIGVISRLKGDIALLSPFKIYQTELHKTEWEFKKDAIYWAGVNFEHNNSIVLQRHSLVILMSFIFLLEAAALAVWAASGLI
jgi:hypothetical protein